MSKDSERLSIVETEIKNISSGVSDIKTWLGHTTQERRDNQEANAKYHESVIHRLAVIETNQAEYKQYQTDCTADREAFKAYQNQRIGKATLFSALIAGVISFGAAWFGRDVH